MADTILSLDDSMIDIAVGEIQSHERLIKDNNQKLVFGENVGQWRGVFPDQPQKNLTESAYLWTWQGRTIYFKKGIENMAADGHADLIFILGQYLPKHKNTLLLREDLLRQKNSLVKKFQRSLIDSRFSDAGADTFAYDTSKWYFISGPNIIDTEDFFYGMANMRIPLPMNDASASDWAISILTSTIYFDNR